MTLGNLKNKIYSILGVSSGDDIPALCFAIDSVARTTTAQIKCIKKQQNIMFTSVDGYSCADMPENFLYAESVDRYGAENIEIINGKICVCGICAGYHTVKYYAYPAIINEATSDETVLEYSDLVADAVAYGTAIEFCLKLYPGDIRRYMEIATEYDSRVADIISMAGKNIRNSVFSGARGMNK